MEIGSPSILRTTANVAANVSRKYLKSSKQQEHREDIEGAESKGSEIL
jgi:hypothetical protein